MLTNKHAEFIKAATRRHREQEEQFAKEIEKLDRALRTKTGKKETKKNGNNSNLKKTDNSSSPGVALDKRRSGVKWGDNASSKPYANVDGNRDNDNDDALLSPRSKKLLEAKTYDNDKTKRLGWSSGEADAMYFSRSLVLLVVWFCTGNVATLVLSHAAFVLVSDVLAHKKSFETELDVVLSMSLRVFALLLGTLFWIFLTVMFATSASKNRNTLAFAFFMSSLTVLPGTHVSSTQALVRTKSTTAFFTPILRVTTFVKLVLRSYDRIFLQRKFRNNLDAYYRATVICATLFTWIGGLFAPLDWSTTWHKYPILQVRLAIAAHTIGTVLASLFNWLDRDLTATQHTTAKKKLF